MSDKHVRRRAAVLWMLGAIAWVLLLPARTLAGNEPALADLFDRMTRAVLAGDKEGYLACVDRTDPIFWKEQQNWARDFDRHVPKIFAVTFDPGKVKTENGVAVVPISMSWKMETPDARERNLSYTARMVERDGKWLYSGEEWNTLEGPGVRVLYADGLEEVAHRVVEVLPEVRTHVDEGFEVHIERVQEVKMYASMKHLQESIYLSYTDGLAGWNEPGESIKLLTGRRSGTGGLKVLLAHEYGHVATFELGPKANDMPWWILEGVAELSAERYGSPESVQRMVRSWASAGRLVAWDQLSDFHTVKEEDQAHVYTQGHHMIGFISDRFGRTARNRWMGAMSNGKSLDEASKEVLGTDFAGLDAMWRESLKTP